MPQSLVAELADSLPPWVCLLIIRREKEPLLTIQPQAEPTFEGMPLEVREKILGYVLTKPITICAIRPYCAEYYSKGYNLSWQSEPFATDYNEQWVSGLQRVSKDFARIFKPIFEQQVVSLAPISHDLSKYGVTNQHKVFIDKIEQAMKVTGTAQNPFTVAWKLRKQYKQKLKHPEKSRPPWNTDAMPDYGNVMKDMIEEALGVSRIRDDPRLTITIVDNDSDTETGDDEASVGDRQTDDDEDDEDDTDSEDDEDVYGCGMKQARNEDTSLLHGDSGQIIGWSCVLVGLLYLSTLYWI